MNTDESIPVADPATNEVLDIRKLSQAAAHAARHG